MHSVSDEVVNPAVVRETSVSSLVRKAPPSCQDNTLPVPVESPKAPFHKRADSGRNAIVVNERIGKRIDHPSEFVNYNCAGNIAGGIRKSLERVLLMKMLRDNCMNFSQGDLMFGRVSRRRARRKMYTRTLVGLKGVFIRLMYSGPS